VLTFGGALICLVLLGLRAIDPLLLRESVAMLILATIFVMAGIRATALVLEEQETLSRTQAHAKILERQVEQQQAAVDALADGLDIAIFLCDARAVVQYANSTARRMFKFSDPTGRPVLAVTLAYDLERLVLQTVQTGLPQTAELPFAYPEERVGIAKAWLEPEGDGRIFLAIHEITDLRRLERVRQDFVANVSHELRTPLTVIRAMAETLKDEERPDEEMHDRYLGKIVDEVDRLSLIANDLLILSAAESNPVRKQACDVADMFRGVVDQLQPAAQEKGLQLLFQGADSCIAEANPAQLSQVAWNLVDNAVKYTFEGGVRVILECNDEAVQVQVQDTGIGIASEHLPRIFERFYRVDKARSRATGGTGLGLSIVKHIVEAHGGTVEVSSALNEGSTFSVTLPRGRARLLELSEA
jgi:two-component system, OmpR family, phosphate regulon sensor histidine kinase PhoR